jgi:mannose-1-phosphate guanylyltransferase
LPGLVKKNLLLEPVGRNTASFDRIGGNSPSRTKLRSVMLVLPCDHLYTDEFAWATAIRKAVQFATNHPMLVTIGIPPMDASSNYGYLQVGECLDRSTNCQVYRVKKFIEKPTVERAGEFQQKADYLWNTGTFAWQPEVFLAALEHHLPETHQVVTMKRKNSENFSELYSSSENISVDYGVMEQVENVAVVHGDFQRIDVGNLASLGDLWPRDEQGNSGFGDILLRKSCDNLIYTDEGLVSLVGVRDLIVIRKGDIVLVCSKSQVAEVKEMVKSEREGYGAIDERKWIVLFDWDGTLIDSLDLKIRNAGALFERALGIPHDKVEVVYRQHSGLPRRQVFRAICQENGLKEAEGSGVR